MSVPGAVGGRLLSAISNRAWSQAAVTAAAAAASAAAGEAGAAAVRSEWVEWQTRVVRRAAENEARGALDVRALAAHVLRALPAPPRAMPVDALLADTAEYDHDVSRVFLATLFLVRVARAPSPPLPFAAPADVLRLSCCRPMRATWRWCRARRCRSIPSRCGC